MSTKMKRRRWRALNKSRAQEVTTAQYSCWAVLFCSGSRVTRENEVSTIRVSGWVQKATLTHLLTQVVLTSLMLKTRSRLVLACRADEGKIRQVGKQCHRASRC